MVKGISKQVIVVQSPEEKLFEQAIFILNESAVGAEGITDEMLLKEAKRLINSNGRRKRLWYYGPVWAFGGALLMGLTWLAAAMI